MKRHVKDQQTTILSLRDLTRNGDTPLRSGDHLENGGNVTFCLSMVRNEPMWQKMKVFGVGVKKLRMNEINLATNSKIVPKMQSTHFSIKIQTKYFSDIIESTD